MFHRAMTTSRWTPLRPEWPTVGLIILCTSAWAAGVWAIGHGETWWLLPLLALPLALHSSLQHEAIHGHPTRSRGINEALVFPAIGLFLPYRRFRRLHLRHHRSPDLTEPLGDPESPYVTPTAWAAMPRWRRRLLTVNNTLAGRLALGPPLSLARLVTEDLTAWRSGRREVATDWMMHLPALAPVLVWLWYCGVPIWLYALLAAWPGLAVLSVRTFAEHRRVADRGGRTAVVERGGLLGLIFLNNHLHAAHHRFPFAPWYRLPALCRQMQDHGMIGGDHFGSYGEIFRRYAFRVREPVADPLARPGR